MAHYLEFHFQAWLWYRGTFSAGTQRPSFEPNIAALRGARSTPLVPLCVAVRRTSDSFEVVCWNGDVLRGPCPRRLRSGGYGPGAPAAARSARR